MINETKQSIECQLYTSLHCVIHAQQWYRVSLRKSFDVLEGSIPQNVICVVEEEAKGQLITARYGELEARLENRAYDNKGLFGTTSRNFRTRGVLNLK